MKKQKPRLDPAQTAALSALVRDAATWTGEPQHEPDASGFDALHREVAGAKRVRMLWGAALLIAILAIAIPMGFDCYGQLLDG